MSDQPYVWQADAVASYAVWAAAKREQLIREGIIEPLTDAERAMAAEGPVDVPQMQAGRPLKEDA